MAKGYFDIEASKGWSYLAVIAFTPVLAWSLVGYVVFHLVFTLMGKLSFTQKILGIWILEAIACFFIYYHFLHMYW